MQIESVFSCEIYSAISNNSQVVEEMCHCGIFSWYDVFVNRMSVRPCKGRCIYRFSECPRWKVAPQACCQIPSGCIPMPPQTLSKNVVSSNYTQKVTTEVV